MAAMQDDDEPVKEIDYSLSADFTGRNTYIRTSSGYQYASEVLRNTSSWNSHFQHVATVFPRQTRNPEKAPRIPVYAPASAMLTSDQVVWALQSFAPLRELLADRLTVMKHGARVRGGYIAGSAYYELDDVTLHSVVSIGDCADKHHIPVLGVVRMSIGARIVRATDSAWVMEKAAEQHCLKVRPCVILCILRETDTRELHTFIARRVLISERVGIANKGTESAPVVNSVPQGTDCPLKDYIFGTAVLGQLGKQIAHVYESFRITVPKAEREGMRMQTSEMAGIAECRCQVVRIEMPSVRMAAFVKQCRHLLVAKNKVIIPISLGALVSCSHRTLLAMAAKLQDTQPALALEAKMQSRNDLTWCEKVIGRWFV